MEFNWLFAADMDYTLLMPGEDIPGENLRACQALKDAGVALTLGTGRSSFLVGKFADAAGIEVPLITGNGGTLFDHKTRKHIFSADFAPEKAEEILYKMLDADADATLYSTEGIFFAPKSDRWWFCEHYNEGVPDDLKAPLFPIDKTSPIPPVNKFLLQNPDPSMTDELLQDPDLEVVFSGPSLLDIMTSGTTKGGTLLKLADYLGIPRDNTFAIGDSENDLSMIESARYGIAVGNADKEIKEKASYIALSCEENGFADAVFNFVIPKVKGLI
ncbi:MAG: HAD family hydrolase [Clostridiales bacterium]|nr:HAD family hydrolase [Clostridiales bacterium]